MLGLRAADSGGLTPGLLAPFNSRATGSAPSIFKFSPEPQDEVEPPDEALVVAGRLLVVEQWCPGGAPSPTRMRGTL